MFGNAEKKKGVGILRLLGKNLPKERDGVADPVRLQMCKAVF